MTSSSYNRTTERSVEDDESHLELDLLDFFLLLLNFSGITANVLIIYLTAKMDLIRNFTYALIVNWAILDIFRLLASSPGLHKWYSYFHDVTRFQRPLFLTCELGLTLFVYILILGNRMKGLEKFWTPIIIWMIVALLVVVHLLQDHFRVVQTTELLGVIFTNLIVALFIISVNCHRKMRHMWDEDERLRLTLGLTFASYWFAFIIIFLLILLLPQSDDLTNPMLLMFAFVETNSIATLYVLTKLNNNFKASLYAMCNINVKMDHKEANVAKYEDYDESNI